MDITQAHLENLEELADGRHHVIPCPVPGHQGERDSPGLDIRYVAPTGGRLPVGRQWLLRCWGARCKYVSIAQSLGIDPEAESTGGNANQMVAAYDHPDGHSRRIYHAWWPDDFPVDLDSCSWRNCSRTRSDRHRHVSVRGSQAGTLVSLWGPNDDTGVLVVVGSEDEASALLRAGVRRTGFIPVTWYRAGRQPETDRDSVEQADWSPVRDRHVALWARDGDDALDEMLRAAHMALDAGATGIWMISPGRVGELGVQDVLDSLDFTKNITVATRGPSGHDPTDLKARVAPGALNATDASIALRFLMDHGHRIVEAGNGQTDPRTSSPASLYIRTESGRLTRGGDLLTGLMWETAQGYRDELRELKQAGGLSAGEFEICVAHLARMESRAGLSELHEQAGTARRFMREHGVLPAGYTLAMAGEVDADTRYLGAPNCVIDLDTGDALVGRDAGDALVSLTIRDPYDADATHPDVELLAECLEEEGLGDLLPALGSALSCSTRDVTYVAVWSGASCCTALMEAVCSALGPDYATRVPADALFHPSRWADIAPQLSHRARARILVSTVVYPYGQASHANPTQPYTQPQDFGPQDGRPPSFVSLDMNVLMEVMNEAEVPHSGIRAFLQETRCDVEDGLSRRLTQDARARQALVSLLVRLRAAQTEPPEGTPLMSYEWTARSQDDDSVRIVYAPSSAATQRTEEQAAGPMQELDRWLESAVMVTGHPGDRMSSAALWQAARDAPSSGSDSERVWGMSRRPFTTRAMQIHGLDSPGSVRIDGAVTTGWTGVRLSDDLRSSDSQPSD